jgi:hypothetical protein
MTLGLVCLLAGACMVCVRLGGVKWSGLRVSVFRLHRLRLQLHARTACRGSPAHACTPHTSARRTEEEERGGGKRRVDCDGCAAAAELTVCRS